MKNFRCGFVALSFVLFVGDAAFQRPSSPAAERAPSTTQDAPPALKKKTTPPPENIFTGNPPMELLVDGSEFIFEYSGPSVGSIHAPPLILKDSYLYLFDGSDTPIKKISTDTGEITPLAAFTGSPMSAVIHNGAVVWVEHNTPISFNSHLSRVNRTSLDGLETTVLSEGGHYINDGGSFEVVVDDAHAYWVNEKDREVCCFRDWVIQKVPLAGGATTTLATVPNRIVAIARDDTYLYWTENSQTTGGDWLKRIPLAGGAIETLVDAQLNGLAPYGWGPAGNIVISGGEVFFGGYAGIMKVSVLGGDVTILKPLSYAVGPLPWKIIVDATTAYWLDTESINRVSRSGGSSTTVVSGLLLPGRDFMIHDGSIVWSDCPPATPCTMMTMPLTGGPVTTLATDLQGIRSLASDDLSLYFIDGGYAYDPSGKIAKLPWVGGAPTTIVSAVMADIVSPHAVDDVNVYFSDYTGIKKVPIDGGIVDILLPHTGQVYDLLTDGEFVYFLDGGLKKIPVDGGPVTLVTNAGTPRLFMDSGHFYWTEQTSIWTGSDLVPQSKLMKAPKAGGPAELIYSDRSFGMVGLDGSDIYFLEPGFPNIIKKISVNGGPITVIGGAADGSTFVFDDKYIYWGDHFSLQRAPKSGGPITPIAMEPGIAFLTIDDTALYWALTMELGIAKLELSAIDRFLTLYTPSFGAAWTIGSRQNISWGFRGMPGKAKIDISRDGGVTWTSISSKKGINNVGILTWKVAKPATNNARIRVCILGSTSTTCDMSEAFRIQ
ncbi:MAG TPA: hypothetical protein VGH16_13230 [Candidatus Binatia bacterium]